MVKSTHAAITNIAVQSARWSENLTSVTEFNALAEDRGRIKTTLCDHEYVIASLMPCILIGVEVIRRIFVLFLA